MEEEEEEERWKEWIEKRRAEWKGDIRKALKEVDEVLPVLKAVSNSLYMARHPDYDKKEDMDEKDKELFRKVDEICYFMEFNIRELTGKLRHVSESEKVKTIINDL